MSEVEGANVETKRDRVRRLFIEPMNDLGWRKPARRSDEDHAADLNRICDELHYLADDQFAVLREALRAKGDGSTRDHWPRPARIVAFAELVEPRPLDALPAVRRWFACAAGEAAEAAGRLVEEYDYWTRFKVPPRTPEARRMVEERAQKNARRLELYLDRCKRGLASPQGEAEWAHGYQERKAQVRRLLKAERVSA